MCEVLYEWFLYLVVSFIDVFSRTTWVYLLKDKSDVFSVFQMFYKMVQTQFNATIKIVRLDNGGEYMSSNLEDYFRERGIIHQTTCVDTPQQNGVAEQKNRHLLEVTRSLMLDMHVPKSYWGDTLHAATYLINRMHSRVLDFKTPLEVLSPPPYTTIGVSPKGVVHIHGPSRSKLDPQSLKCVFVGYSPTKKGYICYHPPSRKYCLYGCHFL
jgi:transposase InsO family protein